VVRLRLNQQAFGLLRRHLRVGSSGCWSGHFFSTTHDQRKEIYYEMQRLIHQDAPAIFLYVPQEIEAASARVHGWEPSPDSRINLHDVWLSE